jgi:hypothetical protein
VGQKLIDLRDEDRVEDHLVDGDLDVVMEDLATEDQFACFMFRSMVLYCSTSLR